MLIHHFGAETQGLVDQNDREKVLRKKTFFSKKHFRGVPSSVLTHSF